jgi:hypothetical protein
LEFQEPFFKKVLGESRAEPLRKEKRYEKFKIGKLCSSRSGYYCRI